MTIELNNIECDMVKKALNKAISDYGDMIVLHDINGDNENANKYEQYFETTKSVLNKLNKSNNCQKTI